ncbi:hypothetical protein [Flexivirga lutea]
MSHGEHRRSRPPVVACAVMLALAGCATPSPTMSDYQTKTRTTARAVAGIVATTRTGAQAWHDGKMMKAYADTMVSHAEDDVGSIVSTYDSRQPPTEAAIQLKDKIDKPLQAASSSLTDLRIALRRNDRQGVAQSIKDLAAPLKTLKGMEQVGL